MILVQVMQAGCLELVESVCRSAKEQEDGGVVLVYVMELPWRLRLDPTLEQPEQDASAAVAAACELVVRWDVPVRVVIRRDRVMLRRIAAAAARYHARMAFSYSSSVGSRGHREARGPAGQLGTMKDVSLRVLPLESSVSASASCTRRTDWAEETDATAEHFLDDTIPVAVVPYLIGSDPGCGYGASSTIAQEPRL